MKRRTLTAQLDTLKAERNDAAKTDAQTAKAKGKLPDDVIVVRRKLGERITSLESELRQIETTLDAKALFVPNSPLSDVPDEVTVLRSWGTPAPKGGKPHWEIAERLGILDLPRGAKLSGSGFPVLMGAGARLARGLINFMLELHTREHGYVEVEPPLLVRREVMIGPGPTICFWSRPRKCRSPICIATRSSTARRCRWAMSHTRPASGARRAPPARTRAACCASTSSTRSS